MRQLFWIVALIAIVIAALATPALAADDSKVKQEITQAAKRYGVDPKLAIAVAKVESNFKQSARGAKGEIGIFQLRPEFFASPAIYDRSGNIDIGVRYLARVRTLCSSRPGLTWINCVNRGPYAKPLKKPALFPYYRRVVAAMRAGTP